MLRVISLESLSKLHYSLIYTCIVFDECTEVSFRLKAVKLVQVEERMNFQNEKREREREREREGEREGERERVREREIMELKSHSKIGSVSLFPCQKRNVLDWEGVVAEGSGV